MGALPSERCSKGHTMSEPNLYHRSDGKRECLTCKRERNRGRRVSDGHAFPRADSQQRVPAARLRVPTVSLPVAQERVEAEDVPTMPLSRLGGPGETRICVACESSLRMIRGKWVCVDVSCGMVGQEQKGKKEAK